MKWCVKTVLESDLERVLNELTEQGWSIHSILDSEARRLGLIVVAFKGKE